jgi:eukaryotic-like serine/threonine-protein kinase
LVTAMAVEAGLAWRRGGEPSRGVVKFSVSPLGYPEITGLPVAVSPDGNRIVFQSGMEGKQDLWVREIDSLSARPLPGTERGRSPFWSPDSRTIGFFDRRGNKLKRVDVAGGPVITICDTSSSNVRGGTWAAAGKDIILFATTDAGIFQVPASGGTPAPVIKPHADKSGRVEDYGWPSFLPDGHHFLYTARTGLNDGTVYAGDLQSGERKRIVETPLNAVFAGRQLLFGRGGKVVAQTFDAAGLRTTGEAIPIADSVHQNNIIGASFFSASRTGTLAWFSDNSAAGLQVTWFDRAGNQAGTVGSVSSILAWAVISPDGSTVATAIGEFLTGGGDVWLYNLSRGTGSRFTFGPAQNSYPLWSPDGTRIAFASTRDGLLHGFVRALGGGTEASFGPAAGNPPHSTLPEDWSPDGRYIVERVLAAAATSDDLWIQPLGADGKAGDRKAFPYLQSEFSERNAVFSPDGKWLAYTSDETGRYEVYTQSFPEPGNKVQISSDGGDKARWSRDGKELFFIGPDRKMMAVPVRSGAILQAGQPRALFDSHIGEDFNVRFDVAKDGRFLIPVQVSTAPINVIVNWPATLKK